MTREKYRDIQIGARYQHWGDERLFVVAEVMLPTAANHAEQQGQMKIVFTDGSQLLIDPEAPLGELAEYEGQLWDCCRRMRGLVEMLEREEVRKHLPAELESEASLIWSTLYTATTAVVQTRFQRAVAGTPASD